MLFVRVTGLRVSLGLALLMLAAGCDTQSSWVESAQAEAHPSPRARSGKEAPVVARATGNSIAQAAAAVRVEKLENAKPEVFVTRGRAGPQRLVFLHGMCGHGMGYAQSFQFAAARWGRLVAPQGDVTCGKGPWAQWSTDLEALDRRIVDSFMQLGLEPEQITLIGYSQGASRAEQLIRKYPERYRYLISIGAPQAVSPSGLRQLRGAVMLAGEHDRQDQMRTGVTVLEKQGIPTTFMELPGARHGAMGKNPEKSMESALDWLYAHAKR
jgi:predicted esterase